ncbi:MAG: lamin tail domain-containing protein [Bacteroidota bacterium]
MKRLLLLFSCLPGVVGAQYSFDFEDGALNSWVQLPADRWEISTVAALSGQFSLHHAFDNEASGVDALAFCTDPPDTGDTLRFSFRYRHSYAPSSTNNWQLAVMAASADLSAQPPPDGWYVGVNFSGSDDRLKLWKVSGGVKSVLLETERVLQQEGCEEDIPLVVLEYFPEGVWQLWQSRSGSPDSLVLLGSAAEAIGDAGKWNGIRYAYSSSQDRKFWLDDLYLTGSFIRDTLPPEFRQALIARDDSVVLYFSEALSLTDSTQVSCGAPSRIGTFCARGKELILAFKDPLPNRDSVPLIIRNIADQEGNVLPYLELDLFLNQPVFGDVVFSELMPDPTPPVYLPPCEYVELYNRSSYMADLSSWVLSSGTRRVTLPAISLEPGAWLCLYAEDCEERPETVLASTFLPNSGGTLVLTDSRGALIHALEYPDPAKLGSWKGEGGWSLERPDLSDLCGARNNWAFSVSDEGGTPGRPNSVHYQLPDEIPPEPAYIGLSDSSLRLHFNEALFPLTPDKSRFILLPDVKEPDSLWLSWPLGKEVGLIFEPPLQDGMSYSLRIPPLSDCAGNLSEESTIPFGWPAGPNQGLLQISEVLYDPSPGCPEFIELHNAGRDFIDLYDFQLCLTADPGDPPDPWPVSENSHLVPPGEYLVVSPDLNSLAAFYSIKQSGHWLEPERFSQLGNTGGSLFLLYRSGNTADRMSFNDAMHHPMLADPQGVSLERVSFLEAGELPENWHSASEASGYATPGRKNSQALEGFPADTLVDLSTTLLTPDNDGWDDVLEIQVAAENYGCVLGILITDLTGYPVRELAESAISGTRECWFWDGLSDDGLPVAPGIYVVHVRFICSGNRGRVVRKPVAVSYR